MRNAWKIIRNDCEIASKGFKIKIIYLNVEQPLYESFEQKLG